MDKIDGASTDRIIEQVKKCPSGALNFSSIQRPRPGKRRWKLYVKK